MLEKAIVSAPATAIARGRAAKLTTARELRDEPARARMHEAAQQVGSRRDAHPMGAGARGRRTASPPGRARARGPGAPRPGGWGNGPPPRRPVAPPPRVSVTNPLAPRGPVTANRPVMSELPARSVPVTRTPGTNE